MIGSKKVMTIGSVTLRDGKYKERLSFSRQLSIPLTKNLVYYRIHLVVKSVLVILKEANR